MTVKIKLKDGSIHAYDYVVNETAKGNEDLHIKFTNGEEANFELDNIEAFTVWTDNGKEIMRGQKMRKAVVGQIAVLAILALGGGTLAGLANGDYQWQKLTDNGQCDENHDIITFVPRMIKDGGIERFKVVVPCNKWFPKHK